MNEHNCSAPGCIETEETATIYMEPTEYNERGYMEVCGRHADFSKDGILVLVNGAASEMSAEILANLQE